jgi:NAD(P)H-quinone oxidoreductase subunit 5
MSVRALAWAPAAIYAAAALATATRRRPGWSWLAFATRAALASSLAGALAACVAPGRPLAQSAAQHLVATLVTLLGWIIGDYANRYLRGEPGQRRFVLALLATLAAVSAVVASEHLLVLIAGWIASSAGLHHLLTYYRDRPGAILVAHKKFLASRLAEACLVAAALLLFHDYHTLDLGTLVAPPCGALTAASSAAITLIAVAVALKSAQLPLHGWLIQVMEAPTPVSALLHAGVVNLGGYVLIRLAPLVSASFPAQALLVVIGSLTAAIAGLVTLTRVSIKVRLAWSTCSQMGLMLMECGLGLYDLALLHLLAHSLYKAYAFLAAGEAVQDSLLRGSIDGDATPSAILSRLLALPAACLIVAGSARAWQQLASLPAVPGIALLILASGLATLLWPLPGRRLPAAAGLAALIACTQLYLAWHWLLGEGLRVGGAGHSPVLAAWALAIFVALYLFQVVLPATARHQAGSRLHAWVYAGLYLDESFTRLTFRLWPARRPTVAQAP